MAAFASRTCALWTADLMPVIACCGLARVMSGAVHVRTEGASSGGRLGYHPEEIEEWLKKRFAA